MAMPRAEPRAGVAPLRRAALALLHLLAAGAGLAAGYDFGSRIGGPVAGVLLALNAALFCSILVGGLGPWWRRLRGG
jgi:hypothetical protein